MAFIIFYFFFLKKFEKVEKTGFFRAKFLLHCTLSFILGFKCLIRLLISKTLLKKMLNDIN